MDLGLEPKSHFMGDAGDPNAYISVTSLLLLTSLFDGKNDSYRELVWLDVLAALIKETPKLKYQVKLKEFRASLVGTLVASYHHFLELDLDDVKPEGGLEDKNLGPEVVDIADDGDGDFKAGFIFGRFFGFIYLPLHASRLFLKF